MTYYGVDIWHTTDNIHTTWIEWPAGVYAWYICMWHRTCDMLVLFWYCFSKEICFTLSRMEKYTYIFYDDTSVSTRHIQYLLGRDHNDSDIWHTTYSMWHASVRWHMICDIVLLDISLHKRSKCLDEMFFKPTD